MPKKLVARGIVGVDALAGVDDEFIAPWSGDYQRHAVRNAAFAAIIRLPEPGAPLHAQAVRRLVPEEIRHPGKPVG